MTKITVYKSNEDGYTRFTCIGHSGFASSGIDIVCASISVLVINTINSLEELAGEDMEVFDNEQEGCIDCRFLHEINDKSKLLMDSMILGLQSIAEQYGKKYLKLIFKDVNSRR